MKQTHSVHKKENGADNVKLFQNNRILCSDQAYKQALNKMLHRNGKQNKTEGSMSCTLCFRVCSKIQYHLKQQLLICNDIKRNLKSMSKLGSTSRILYWCWNCDNSVQLKNIQTQKLWQVCWSQGLLASVDGDWANHFHNGRDDSSVEGKHCAKMSTGHPV